MKSMAKKRDEKESSEPKSIGTGRTYKLDLTEKVPITEKVSLGRNYKLDILEKVPINTTYRFLFSTLNKSVGEALKHFSDSGAISLGFKGAQEALMRLQPTIESAAKALQPYINEIQKIAESPLIREVAETQKRLNEQSAMIVNAMNLPSISIPLETERKFTIAIPPSQSHQIIYAVDKETAKEMVKEIVTSFIKEIGYTPPLQSSTNKKDDIKQISVLTEIYYNKQTGIGYAHTKRFKFKNDQEEFSVFAKMYDRINKPISRIQVLKLSGYQEEKSGGLDRLANNSKRKPSIHTSATYFINDLAKKMRERTGLNTDQIVNNNGELTLVGRKLKNPPK